jgi:IS30 family transposase
MEEREIISQMSYAGESRAAIGRRLGRHKSTIGRELRRNASGERYSAVAAHKQAAERRRNRPLVRKMERSEIDEQVRSGLAKHWSPDQISGRMRREHTSNPCRCVSHQTIYNWIKQDANREHWESFLRFGGRRPVKDDRRGRLPRTVEIDKRPKIVSRRSRFGDWEGDTIVGVRHRGAVVTHVERKSGFLRAAKVAARKSEPVNRATKRLFADLPPQLRRTLTLDNGKEFAGHETMARQTGLAIYFADPYASWQRGTNENTNGLLRQFFPKGTDFTQVSHQQIRAAVSTLNDRPRKRLGYRTPREVLKRWFPVAFET